jgi:hypothetical protein
MPRSHCLTHGRCLLWWCTDGWFELDWRAGRRRALVAAGNRGKHAACRRCMFVRRGRAAAQRVGCRHYAWHRRLGVAGVLAGHAGRSARGASPASVAAARCLRPCAARAPSAPAPTLLGAGLAVPPPARAGPAAVSATKACTLRRAPLCRAAALRTDDHTAAPSAPAAASTAASNRAPALGDRAAARPQAVVRLQRLLTRSKTPARQNVITFCRRELRVFVAVCHRWRERNNQGSV